MWGCGKLQMKTIIAILLTLLCAALAWLNYIPLEHLDGLDLPTVQTGYKEMTKHRIVICGITRDNAVELPVVIKHIEHTGQHFADYRVIVFENDSRDGTKQVLAKWQAGNPKVHIISKDFGNVKRPSLEFMAAARNQYMTKLFNDPQYQDFDMVMVVDMDHIHGWDDRGVADSFAKIDRWDSVGSNGIYDDKGTMYDLLAFRSPDFPHRITRKELGYKTVSTECLKKYGKAFCERVYPVGSNLVPVQSCFGGMAFYKKQYIKGCKYASIDNDCEHLPFHACLREQNQGRMVMNPSQVLRYFHYLPLLVRDFPIVIKVLLRDS